MEQTLIEIKEGTARHPLYRFKEPVNVTINADEHIAIVGPNGSGKSMLVDMLTGKHPLLGSEPRYDFTPSPKKRASENIQYMTFRDSYGTGDSTYYYQQRWNQQEINENMPKASTLLDEAFRRAMKELSTNEERQEYTTFRNHLYDMFQIRSLLDKYIILLSSGELRKVQLTKALLARPRILIIDNPFIGLDVNSRGLLRDLLTRLSNQKDLTIVLVLSRPEDIPLFITHVIPVHNMHVDKKQSLKDFLAGCSTSMVEHPLPDDRREAILQLPYKSPVIPDGEDILDFRHVTIRYDRHFILNDLNWIVKSGERWVLSGENGSGKSTLLSLICADNPQSYACDISLFGHRRGSGESIWEIKKHIGYVSPEMHRAYLKDIPAVDIVASGLRDTVGLYYRPKPEMRETCLQWMHIFGIENIADRTFLKLSSGEQRLVLLARAFVKDPDLLLLDEPFHGLDNELQLMVKDIIETFCRRRGKTLIMVTHYQEELPPVMDHSLFLTRHDE